LNKYLNRKAVISVGFEWPLHGCCAAPTAAALRVSLSLPEKLAMPCGQSFPDFVSEYRKMKIQ
jgi:hypothetical protein